VRTAAPRQDGGRGNVARTQSTGATAGAAGSRPVGSRPDILAIVGSHRGLDREDLAEARALIEGYLTSRRPDRVVTGGAVGIDTLAGQIAGEYGIPVTVLKPSRQQWPGPGGFRERNAAIVAACTRLLVIRSIRSTTYGSVWTANLAEESGRPVRRHQVPAAAPLPGTGPARVPDVHQTPPVADDGRVRSLTDSDAGLTEILGPRCEHCGWRTGTTVEPRPHRPAIGTEPACPLAGDPAPVA